jgi:hypothetical protein
MTLSLIVASKNISAGMISLCYSGVMTLSFLPLLLLLFGLVLAAFPALILPVRVFAGKATSARPSVVGVRRSSQVLEKAVRSDGTLFATRLARVTDGGRVEVEPVAQQAVPPS